MFTQNLCESCLYC